MVGAQLHTVLGRLRRVVAPRGDGALTEAELLRRVVAGRDEAAFEVLVWRHAPLVWGVCRRLLRHEQDAEDAFQAAFLVLAKKAHTLGRAESLGAWLYRVAYRVALRARANATR